MANWWSGILSQPLAGAPGGVAGEPRTPARLSCFHFAAHSQCPARYRIPDICVVALPYKVSPILERPDLAIEIVSPDDRFSALLEKVAEYLQAGVANVWVVDPYQRVVFEADSAGVRKAPSHRVTTSLTGEVDFAELFAALDEPAE